MDNVYIQYQDLTGNWRTVNVLTINNSQMILAGMQNLQSLYPNSRIRAVDTNNRVIDIL